MPVGGEGFSRDGGDTGPGAGPCPKDLDALHQSAPGHFRVPGPKRSGHPRIRGVRERRSFGAAAPMLFPALGCR